MTLPKLKASDYKFSDFRLSKRFIKIISALSKNLTLSIPQLMKDKHQAKATYNFFKNKKVTPDSIYINHLRELRTRLETYFNAALSSTVALSTSGTRRILALSDTVELDYTTKENAKLLGALSYKKRRGLLVHNTLLVNSLGSPIDLLTQKFIIRKDEDWGKSKERKYHPIETKESYKWYEHFIDAQSLLGNLSSETCTSTPAYEMIYIADREGDINELFQAKQNDNMHYIIRSQHNRNLFTCPTDHATSTQKRETMKLQDYLNAIDVDLEYSIEIIHPITKKKRVANVQMKYSEVNLKMIKPFGWKYYKEKNIEPPKRPYKEELTLYAVEVKEINPTKDIEQPIHWVLLTSLPLNNTFEALQIISYYKIRWIIERFHYLLKSGGANVEHLNFKEPHQLINALISYSFAAMDVLRMKYLAENQPKLPIYQAGITLKEYEILYRYVQLHSDKNVLFDPDIEPTIKDFVINLGKIAGFAPSKRQPIPGLKILSYAYQKFKLILEAFELFCQRTE